jgi:hypothetical protein
VQRQPLEEKHQPPSPLVEMGAPGARNSFVQDISEKLEGSWRWCQQKPTVKVVVPSNLNLKYMADFTVPEVTFKDTGPVTIAFTLNDHLVDRVRYTKAGQLHFEKPVPAAWVLVDKPNLLAAEIDKMWVSKEDGSRLGFILARIGLIQ